jgi:ribonucleoside-diphosphate reductase alpha chain
LKGYATLKGCPEINRETLKEKGFTDNILDSIEKQLLQAFELKFAFNKWSLGEDFCKNVLKYQKTH